MELNSLIDYCRSHDYIYCYGAGNNGRIIRNYLKECKIELSGYIVSDCIDTDARVLGIPVRSITDFRLSERDCIGIVIGVSCQNQGDVINLLEEYGITDYYCVGDEEVKEADRRSSYNQHYYTGNNVTVFIYHRVADIPLDTWKLCVKPQLFEEQIIYIKKNYLLLRSEEDWNAADGKRAAVITFDDGYEDIYTNALPILEKHDAPATVFVATCNLDTDCEFWWDELEKIVFGCKEDVKSFSFNGAKISVDTLTDKVDACYKLHPYFKRMDYSKRNQELKHLESILESNLDRNYCHSMSTNQLMNLSKSPLMTIGGHTVTHSCLANESTSIQDWEITQSKEEIESIIGRQIEVFSYPFGQAEDFSEETIHIAEECGYKKVFAAFPGIASVNTDYGYVPRINIGQEMYFSNAVRLIGRYETLFGDRRI